MRTGQLDRQITIEKKVVVGQDPIYGTDLIDWAPLVAQVGSPVIAVRFWANVEDVPPSRSEAVKQGLVVARNQTKITIRWRSDVDSSMRVKVHGVTDVIYQIVGGPAAVDGRKAFLEMMCERYTS